MPENPPALAEGEHLFTSESVTEGHPDKVADQISDSVLDAALTEDAKSRVACETMVNTGLVVVSGEIRTDAELGPERIEQIARDAVERIGYTDPASGFSNGGETRVLVEMDEQSADIAQGVDEALEKREGDTDELDREGAGDQGMMFGYATAETASLMPMPIHLAHRLAEKLTEVRRSGALEYLRPDGKTQVTVRYEDGKPAEVTRVLISTMHAEDADLETGIRPDLWEQVVVPVLDAEPGAAYDSETLRESLLVNPTGRFVAGGPAADAGLTGRKIIVDTYGGAARHGGGAFSGKDPSKVDRSAAYAARWVAKNVVAAGIAERCEIQIAYAIGVAHPVSMMVNTYGTGKVSDTEITRAINEVFDLRPLAFRQALDLHRPIYAKTAAYGHFGREDPDFTWERADRVDGLREAAGAAATA